MAEKMTKNKNPNTLTYFGKGFGFADGQKVLGFITVAHKEVSSFSDWLTVDLEHRQPWVWLQNTALRHTADVRRVFGFECTDVHLRAVQSILYQMEIDKGKMSYSQ